LDKKFKIRGFTNCRGGGILADSAGNIGASFNRGNVKNASVQGGIAGKVSKAFNVYNTGLVEKFSDSARVGNLFGENTPNASYIEENGLSSLLYLKYAVLVFYLP